MTGSRILIVIACILVLAGAAVYLGNQTLNADTEVLSSGTDMQQSVENGQEPVEDPFDSLEESYTQRVDDGFQARSEDDLMAYLMRKYNEDLQQTEKEDYTFAVLGTDERGDETSRSDIIMLIKYWPDDQKAVMISVPRDTRVRIDNRGLDKINHAFAFGGRTLLEKTLSTLLDEEIDYYFRLNFESFVRIIDEIGGVQVNAQKDFATSYGDVIVPRGEQRLDGEEALFYVRYRSDAEGDFGRIRRQQEVIRSMGSAIFSADHRMKTSTFESIYENELETDMDSEDFKRMLYRSLKQGGTLDFEAHTLKTRSKIIDGIWFEIVNEDHLELLRTLLDD